MINPLPWKLSKSSTELQEYKVISDATVNECVLHVHDFELSDDNAQYIVKACNMFPELVEAVEKLIQIQRDNGTENYEDYSRWESLLYQAKESVKE